jgi:ComF family protein
MNEELAENAKHFQCWTLVKVGKILWRGFLQALVPARCLACGESVQDAAVVCVNCWQKLKLLDEPLCDVMGTAFAYDQGEGVLSAQALSHPPPWNKSRAAMVFDENSKGFVHAFKYGDKAEAGLFMLRMMQRAGHKLIAEADVIVPVPLHWRRLWHRRFNQAAYLAQKIAKDAAKPYEAQLLKRARATRQQVGLKADERRANMRKAFVVADPKAKLRGKKILLVDDVRTTGATISACVEALKAAGVHQVFVLTFALVDGPFRPHIEGHDETDHHLYH